jgi:septal ring factor EnvC (AmiA/AmiB activator)
VRIIFVFLFVFYSVSAMAAPPTPAKKSTSLGYDTQLEAENENKKALEKKAKKIEGTLKSTQSDLVKIAKDIQANEKDMQRLNKDVKALEAKRDDIQGRLQKDQGSIANLILALERIRRLPPEALIVKPDAPLKTAQSAMLMQNILPGLQGKADTLRVELEELAQVSSKLEKEKTQLTKTSVALQEQHKKLSGMLAKRKKLYASAQSDLKAREARIKTISNKAKNLKDLVQKLDQESRTRQEKAKARNVVLKTPSAANVPTGAARLPISGTIKTRYNQPDNFGAPSKGIDIEGRGGALVVAPMGGVVKFAGPFKNYGGMIILEHKGGYHSLVAGLEKIDTVVGQKLSAGEPVGLLHHEKDQNPVLYYELRHNGKPINPAKKFSEL